MLANVHRLRSWPDYRDRPAGAASRSGNFDALLAVLDPDVVLRADGPGQRSRWSRVGTWRSTAGRVRLHDRARRIVGIDLIADPARPQQLELTLPEA